MIGSFKTRSMKSLPRKLQRSPDSSTLNQNFLLVEVDIICPALEELYARTSSSDGFKRVPKLKSTHCCGCKQRGKDEVRSW